MGHIFISYSHKDTAYAHQLAEALQKRNFEAWIDARLDYGSQWPLEIQKQLDTCDAFILVMSPRAFSSEWVQSELSRAKRKQKPVFPLLLEGDEPWLTVESTQFIDVRGGTLPPEKFYQCLEEVMSYRKASAIPGQQTPVRNEPKPIKLKRSLKVAGIFSVFIVVLGIGFWTLPKLFLREPASIIPPITATVKESSIVPPATATLTETSILPPIMVTVKDAYMIRGNGAPTLEEKAYKVQDPADMFAPGTTQVFVSLKPSDQVLWSYDWCAGDAKTLESNLKAIKVQFILNGSQISGLYLAPLDYHTDILYCHSVFAALSDWPAGVHHLTIKAVFTKMINDGADDYQPGEYLTDYTVTVKP